MLSESVPYEELRYHDYEDATFWIPHQQEPRMVRFNRLTSSVDEIITRCGYPESERERLTEQHRRTAEFFLNDYEGPVHGTIPLIGDTLPSAVGRQVPQPYWPTRSGIG